MNTFGSKLKEARKAMGLTQKELADKIGAKHNSVSNWENDQNKPDPDTIELICGALGIEPNYLLKSDFEKRMEAYANVLNETHASMMVNKTERNIITNFREADEVDRAIVLRTLNVNETNNSVIEISKKKKYEPTEEDIKSLVARNGKKITREQAYDLVSLLFSEDDDEE